jgi:SNF2 family DNA or RNA helicase
MPRIFDNIDEELLPALTETLAVSQRADFCVGYFNLRGWRALGDTIENWSGGDDSCCRLLVGMQRPASELLREMLSVAEHELSLDNPTVIRLKKQMAQEFRNQLMFGVPNNADEQGLRRLSKQIKAKKVVVKLHLRYPLHAKLYLLFRADFNNPVTAYLGSSNLTMAGLKHQGELNVDVLEHDACKKLTKWFNDRWNDRWCVDISNELAAIIDESWARETPIPPYHIYLKMAYHLAKEARDGLSEFKLPPDLPDRLFEFQAAAVKIAAHHLNKRDGVLIGDVVGLGKTVMAAALVRIFQDDRNWETLILCPKNLVPMWEDYVYRYRLVAKIIPTSRAINELPNTKRYRLVLVDESQNLRNREGKIYKVIQEYIAQNDSKCILLSATPYNKTYLDLSAQLRLFVPEDRELGLRPEQRIRELGGEVQFLTQHQVNVRTLAAFEKSEHADDWRELMRLFLVRRTRSFIEDNYAEFDPVKKRKFLTFSDGTRSYFPTRVPKTLKFDLNESDPNDQYARLYSQQVVDIVKGLTLARYGLGNFVDKDAAKSATETEKRQIDGLSRAGKRLMGFCRTNLFKRLESGGFAFIQSVDRHILRNFIYLHAIENDLDLPIGTQGAEILENPSADDDPDKQQADFAYEDGEEDNAENEESEFAPHPYTEKWYRARAKEIYELYETTLKRRFKWIRPDLFQDTLGTSLAADAQALIGLLKSHGEWDASKDTKLNVLRDLLTQKHANDKVLIFTQFADTAYYLARHLSKLGVKSLEPVTGDTPDPTALAHRFSPVSNKKEFPPNQQLRVLVATDILSEGQNLQDCSAVVNFDIPWAIIRLVQRAGRVDRIGQQADNIYCYSFLPADGVERIIKLRSRIKQRLKENGEVIGSDEQFFEDDKKHNFLKDLFTEKAGIMDGGVDSEVDLASYAYQIWRNATKDNPELRKQIETMPDVVYSTRKHTGSDDAPEGVLVYMKTSEGNDALAWMKKDGTSYTQSQLRILDAAKCDPDTPALPRHPQHHDLVQKGVVHMVQEEKNVGGQLGRPRGARFQTYARLKSYQDKLKSENSLWLTEDLLKVVDAIYRHPLRSIATDSLNRQLRSGISDESLAELCITLYKENRLCLIEEESVQEHDPQIICSMGLFSTTGE